MSRSLNSIALHLSSSSNLSASIDAFDDFLLLKTFSGLNLSYSSLFWSVPISQAITLQHNLKATFPVLNLEIFSSTGSSTSLSIVLSYVVSLHPKALNMLEF